MVNIIFESFICSTYYVWYIVYICNTQLEPSEFRTTIVFLFFCLFSTLFDFLPFEVILKQSEVDTISQAIQIKVYNNMSAMSIYGRTRGHRNDTCSIWNRMYIYIVYYFVMYRLQENMLRWKEIGNRSPYPTHRVSSHHLWTYRSCANGWTSGKMQRQVDFAEHRQNDLK